MTDLRRFVALVCAVAALVAVAAIVGTPIEDVTPEQSATTTTTVVSAKAAR